MPGARPTSHSPLTRADHHTTPPSAPRGANDPTPSRPTRRPTGSSSSRRTARRGCISSRCCWRGAMMGVSGSRARCLMTGERGRAGFWASSLHFTWPSWYSPCYPSSFPLIVQHAASRGKVLVQAVSTAWVTKGPHISSLFIPNSGSVCKRFLPRLASHRLASPRHIAVRPLTAPASSTRTAPSTSSKPSSPPP
jgi:hypothetical protein